jgi:hypothetical protein
VLRALSGLDKAIITESCYFESRAQPVPGDGLVVARIDRQTLLAQDYSEPATRRQLHRVPARGKWRFRVRPVLIAIDVLQEAATKADVEELMAAADCQDRQVTPQRFIQESQLESISLRPRRLRPIPSRLAVKRRVDIDAAGQCQTCAITQRMLAGMLIEVDWHEARVTQAAPVPLDTAARERLPECDRDWRSERQA